MRRTATMTGKDQVTAPTYVWRRFGLRQGGRGAFDAEDGVATLRPLSAERDAFDFYAGALATLPDEAAAREWLRDLRDDDGSFAWLSAATSSSRCGRARAPKATRPYRPTKPPVRNYPQRLPPHALAPRPTHP